MNKLRLFILPFSTSIIVFFVSCFALVGVNDMQNYALVFALIIAPFGFMLNIRQKIEDSEFYFDVSNDEKNRIKIKKKNSIFFIKTSMNLVVILTLISATLFIMSEIKLVGWYFSFGFMLASVTFNWINLTISSNINGSLSNLKIDIKERNEKIKYLRATNERLKKNC